MLAGNAALTDEDTLTDFKQVAAGMSDEVSRLILHALTSVNRDEAGAVALMKRASTLLRADVPADVERNTPGGLAAWQIKRVRQYVDERFSESISLHDLARLVKLSTSYFSAAFKVSFGMSPHNYIVSRRVEHAKDRLANSDAPLSEIALDCGLADQAHLSRIFRRATGTTPSAWRRYDAPREMTTALPL